MILYEVPFSMSWLGFGMWTMFVDYVCTMLSLSEDCELLFLLCFIAS